MRLLKINKQLFGLRWLLLCLVIGIASCSGALPKGEKVIKSPWSSFAEAKTSYDQIVLDKTKSSDLKTLGFDPYTTANVRIMSYLDIAQKFSPYNTTEYSTIPPSVQLCLAARESCMAYEVTPGENKSKRVGNVFLDLLHFNRKTIETGWKFDALIVLNHDIVVYKIWSGEPILDGMKQEINPLGPLQGSIGSMAKDAAGI
jgi:hypothetical protein